MDGRGSVLQPGGKHYAGTVSVINSRAIKVSGIS